MRDVWPPDQAPGFPVLPATLDLPPVPATRPLSDTQFALRALRDDTLATFLAADQRLAQTLTPLTTINAPLSAQDPIQTPMTLHRGHLATLLTAGRLTGAIGTGDLRHLVKGHIQQYRVQTSHRATDTGYQESFETRYHVVLTTLHPDGQYKVWSPTDDDGIPIAEDADDSNDTALSS
ncbi:MAG: hypothetical protein C7B44_06915 [Sulfobacillus thermosulfidooxidans]|nr:MAG: hypothetical protein C7B44_06915 [Sulfobacillus thermosulfidooxidans]